MLSFEITAEEQSKITKWLKEHNKICKFAKPENCGAIGGRLTYCFTGTSLGQIGRIQCACKEEFCFTDFDDW